MFYFAVNSLYIPLIQNLCVQASSTTKQGVIMGFFNSMKALGMIVGALMAGFSYNLDPKMPFLIAALFFLISAIVMLMYKKEIKSWKLTVKIKMASFLISKRMVAISFYSI